MSNNRLNSIRDRYLWLHKSWQQLIKDKLSNLKLLWRIIKLIINKK
jgi:hypothetical protein